MAGAADGDVVAGGGLATLAAPGPGSTGAGAPRSASSQAARLRPHRAATAGRGWGAAMPAHPSLRPTPPRPAGRAASRRRCQRSRPAAMARPEVPREARRGHPQRQRRRAPLATPLRRRPRRRRRHRRASADRERPVATRATARRVRTTAARAVRARPSASVGAAVQHLEWCPAARPLPCPPCRRRGPAVRHAPAWPRRVAS